MTTDIAPANGHADILERVLIAGDLAKLTPAERVSYYSAVCTSLSLNPLTRPFEYIVLNGKLTLYALRAATDQLRSLRGVSITGLEESLSEDGILTVTATARTRDGRTDRDVGAVSLAGLRGEALANARMRAITKSKRRVTLSICGLGWLDDSELDGIPQAAPVAVDHATGEIVQSAQVEAPVALPEGKRWNERQLGYFWAQLGALEPRVTTHELHSILGVTSLHDWAGDLDEALGRVFAARQRAADAASAERAADARGDPPPLHPEGSVEAEWQRWSAVESAVMGWNAGHPTAEIRYAAPPRDAGALQVGAYATGLENRLAKAARAHGGRP